ncbi:hypothetical protein QQP08_023449, partial [Theobroma cacao]
YHYRTESMHPASILSFIPWLLLDPACGAISFKKLQSMVIAYRKPGFYAEQSNWATSILLSPES